MRTTPHRFSRRLGPLLGAAAAAVFLAGCGLSNPNTVQLGAPSSSAPTTSPTSPTTPSTTQPTATNAGGETQQQAIEQYAGLWCNWTAGDLHAHERQLEAISVGGARAQEQVALAAATQSGPPSQITNTCTIEALAPGRADAAGDWVLVTASQTSTPSMQSLAPQYHVTYITLAKRGSRYLINSWLPQS